MGDLSEGNEYQAVGGRGWWTDLKTAGVVESLNEHAARGSTFIQGQDRGTRGGNAKERKGPLFFVSKIAARQAAGIVGVRADVAPTAWVERGLGWGGTRSCPRQSVAAATSRVSVLSWLHVVPQCRAKKHHAHGQYIHQQHR